MMRRQFENWEQRAARRARVLPAPEPSRQGSDMTYLEFIGAPTVNPDAVPDGPQVVEPEKSVEQSAADELKRKRKPQSKRKAATTKPASDQHDPWADE